MNDPIGRPPEPKSESIQEFFRPVWKRLRRVGQDFCVTVGIIGFLSGLTFLLRFTGLSELETKIIEAIHFGTAVILMLFSYFMIVGLARDMAKEHADDNHNSVKP